MRTNTDLIPSPLLERRLLLISSVFMCLHGLILTFVPVIHQAIEWADLDWGHWWGVFTWGFVFFSLHFLLRRRLPEADPYLLPIVSLLTGWGLLTIWRLLPEYGFRQTIWLLIAGAILFILLAVKADLSLLRKYKYLWLIAGLALTGVTLLVGVNPSGGEQRLWLGWNGIYLQPSEPLKLLLVAFLSAYFSVSLSFKLRPMALLAPTIIMSGVALLLLLVQRDLGTASILILLYASILYVATGKLRILVITLAILILAGLTGYSLYDVVRLRIDAWVNPWADPSGRSYQIVQALIAIANGGVLGRGPGLGYPDLVPVALSDFIFTSIGEETGLLGTLGLLALFAALVMRGLTVALRASDRYQRILAAGLSVYLGTQAILIIGGNLRLLPLTGVTLPFVSYGGSSLLTSLLICLILLMVSGNIRETPAEPVGRTFLVLGTLLASGFLALALLNGWWAIVRAPALLARTDNPRRAITDRFVRRGAILDRYGQPINHTIGEAGDYQRVYDYPPIATVSGFNSILYGQSGLEASLDGYLRGTRGNAARLIWLNHILYGSPPPGLDIRTSIDLTLQEKADQLLGDHTGAIVLINAETGEILVMASHPWADPEDLDLTLTEGVSDSDPPLLNRATQALYPFTDSLAAIQAIYFSDAENPVHDAHTILAEQLGFFSSPEVHLLVSNPVTPDSALQISPLQAVLAAAAFSHQGILPAPRLAMAVDTPDQGWVILPAQGQTRDSLRQEDTSRFTNNLMIAGQPFWESVSSDRGDNDLFTWYLGGTVSQWQGSPLAVAILVEGDNPYLVQSIGQTLLKTAIK